MARLFFFVCVVVCVGCQPSQKTSESTQAGKHSDNGKPLAGELGAKPVATIEAYKLWSFYRDKPTQADGLFKDKLVSVVGTPAAVRLYLDKDRDNRYGVEFLWHLELPQDASRVHVMCDVLEPKVFGVLQAVDFSFALREVNPVGACTLVVTGRCRGVGKFSGAAQEAIHMTDCVLSLFQKRNRGGGSIIVR